MEKEEIKKVKESRAMALIMSTEYTGVTLGRSSGVLSSILCITRLSDNPLCLVLSPEAAHLLNGSRV